MKRFSLLAVAVFTITCPSVHQFAVFGTGLGMLEGLRSNMTAHGVSKEAIASMVKQQMQEGVDQTKCTGPDLPPISPAPSVEVPDEGVFPR